MDFFVFSSYSACYQDLKFQCLRREKNFGNIFSLGFRILIPSAPATKSKSMYFTDLVWSPNITNGLSKLILS